VFEALKSKDENTRDDLDVINMYIKTNKKHSTMTIAKTLNALI
jgi:hypothetical protein